MQVLKKLNCLAALGCLGITVAGLLACAEEESVSKPNNGNNVVISPSGDTVVVNPETGDSSKQQIDTTSHIDPITGDTIKRIDTLYIPLDSTIFWVGKSALVITEIAPVNLNWLDESGNDPGWVEIYNAGSEDANLKGYSLIETVEKGRKWIFGDEIIPAKSFRTVFCDKKNLVTAPKDLLDTIGGKTVVAGHGRTHTNWKLEKDGGTVYLVDQYFGIRDSVKYPALESGLSWGIVDGGAWKYFENPTPEKPNNAEKAYDGMAPEFKFNGSQGGFYNEPVVLNAPTVSGGMKVRCTQDGSVPTKSSPEFNQTITIDKNTVLRCAAFMDGLLTKKVVTNTYFIGEQVKMPVVAVSVDPVFFQKYYKKTNGGEPDMKHDQMYAPNESYPDDSGELPVHVEYFENGSSSKEKAWEIDAGISLMGGWSRMERKKSVAIAMREEYQDGWLHYPLFETRKNAEKDKYKAFNLRNNGNRFVADYFADAVGGAALEGSGVDYQRSRQVVVFYNGTYYGIHDMRERYNKNYVESNYGIDAGTVNFIKHLNETVTASNGTTADYLAMLAFINKNDMSVPANYEMAKSLIDIGNFADYMIAEMYIHNGDWPDNNVRAWKSPEQPWKFMVYDLDHGFRWEWSVAGFSESTNMFTWVKKGGKNGCNSGEFCFAGLYNSLIKSNDFKRLFINHASVMLANYMNGKNITEKAKFLAGMLDASDVARDMEVEAYKERRNSYGHEFDPYGEKLGSWASERDSEFKSELASEFGVSGEVSVTIAASGQGTVLMDGMMLPGKGSYTGKFFAGLGMELTAVPAEGAMFAGWSDGSVENPHVITTASDVSITANFK